MKPKATSSLAEKSVKEKLADFVDSDADDDSSVYSGLEDDEEETSSSEDDEENVDDKDENVSLEGESDDIENENNDLEVGNDVSENEDSEGENEDSEIENDDDEDKSEDSEIENEDSENDNLKSADTTDNLKKVKNRLKDTGINSDMAESNEKQPDEYEFDSSDEEDIRNTVGNIPMNWYDEYPHIGYNLVGEKILKPKKDDEIDDFLKKIDDPNYWRTVLDKMTGQKVVLSDEDVNIIKRLQGGSYPTDKDINLPFEDFFTYEVMKHPLSNRPEHKRSFIPSLHEKQKVGRLVHAIKMGWLKPRAQKLKEDEEKFYMLWDNDASSTSKRMQHHIPAPKMKLPGHEESYNPPPEYLFTEEEEEKWKSQEPEERKINFIPKMYSSLRLVPAYQNFIQERFERCLDLYLCPRQRKMRANVDPNDLIPKLPKPRDLHPFPTVQALVYTGHTNMVRCICVEPLGQFLASGSDDETIKVWEVLTGRCLRTFQAGSIISSLTWCPNESVCLLLAAVGQDLLLINPNVGDKVIISNTDVFFRQLEVQNNEQIDVQWIKPDEKQWLSGIRFIIKHPKDVRQVTWHAKGDYFASVMTDTDKTTSRDIVIHCLSKNASQLPFRRLTSKVQSICFHPLKPVFFVATQKFVRIYNLLKQELVKKLAGNCKWISSIAVHPMGDNIIIGSYDCKLNWFDVDLSAKPYKVLRYHKKAIRHVDFHKRYPLFASSSDDGSVIVSHGMVYSDLMQNPLIVPVKVLKGHKTVNELSVLDCCFHPVRPWIFSSGADSTIRLYS